MHKQGSNTLHGQAPLRWPEGWQRTPSAARSRSLYAVSLAKAWSELEHELRLLGAHGAVVSTSLPMKNDGRPRAGSERLRSDDPGAAVYFQHRGKPVVLACDCWMTVRDNLRAIGITVAAMRSIERAGAHELLDRAFEGFKALGPKGSPPVPRPDVGWCETLEASQGATMAEVRAAFPKLACQSHPGAGGNHADMQALNAAYAAALASFGGSTRCSGRHDAPSSSNAAAT